jgi:crotonobetainyl-CoA:carnitine CoA-transferase CaiB-like acyl-CoA transferase
LGFEDLRRDKSYEINAQRTSQKLQLEREIGNRLSSMPTVSIISKLKDTGVAYSKFNTAGSLIDDPHFRARKLAQRFKYGNKIFRTIVNPAVIDGRRVFTKRSPPVLGQHTNETLKQMNKG